MANPTPAPVDQGGSSSSSSSPPVSSEGATASSALAGWEQLRLSVNVILPVTLTAAEGIDAAARRLLGLGR